MERRLHSYHYRRQGGRPIAFHCFHVIIAMKSSSQNTGGLSGATSYEHMEQALSQVSSQPADAEADSSETHSQQHSPKEGLSTSHESERATTYNALQVRGHVKSDLVGGYTNTSSQDGEKPSNGGHATGDGSSPPHAWRSTTASSSHTNASGTELSENDEPHDPTPSPTSREVG